MMSSSVMMPMGLAAPSRLTPRFRDSSVMAGEALPLVFGAWREPSVRLDVDGAREEVTKT